MKTIKHKQLNKLKETCFNSFLVVTFSLLIGLITIKEKSTQREIENGIQTKENSYTNALDAKELIVLKDNPILPNTTNEPETIEFTEVEKASTNPQEFIIVDARPSLFYEDEHIPNSISLPVETLKEAWESTLPKLKNGKKIIVYCQSIACQDSTKLANKLSKTGIKDVYIFKGGMNEWKTLGGKLER